MVRSASLILRIADDVPGSRLSTCTYKQNALANQKSTNWLSFVNFLSVVISIRVPALSSALTPFRKVDKMLRAEGKVLRCSAEKLFHNALSLF